VPNFTRDSHYVPQATLKRWSDDGNRVYAYRILVSRPEVPVWELRSIRRLACQQDLYTCFSGGQEVDEFERWIAREYEEPGLSAINNLLARARLSPTDWQRIVRFVATQDVRTPLTFIEWMRRWDQEIPDVLEKSLRGAIDALQRARAEGISLVCTTQPNAFSESFRVHIETESQSTPGSGQALIRAEVTAGRSLWIASMRHLLTGVANVLCQQRWSVIEPFGDEQWPLTDHPVLRLNYYRPGHYDFGGGWGREGSEIMMPISPRNLLYVQIGKKAPNRFSFSLPETQLVQRLIVERAHRWVFATHPAPWVAQVRPRVVDQALFVAEQEAWKHWHQDQVAAERQHSA
jgi:hypothetical protein